MPIHDWSRAEAGMFHHFHQAWTIEISNALNGGILPADYFALAEQVIGGPIPDVVTLQHHDPHSPVTPLEQTYQATWTKCPAILREIIAP